MKLSDFGLKSVDFQNPQLENQAEGFTRRGFIMTSLAVGFAVATQPVRADAIVTDSKGLVAGEVSIPVSDGKIPAYRAAPAKAGQYPIILVTQEIFGVHEHIKDMCRRFAKLGYYAIAPELFARQGDVSKMTDIGEILSTVVAKVPDDQVMSDLDATLAFAKASGSADSEKVAIVGYCWGGRTTWLYANHNPAVKAGVAYYGLLDGMKSEIKANDPVDIAEKIKVPVLGLYAGKDTMITPAVIEKMQEGINQSGSGSEIVVFPGVNHGFNADYRPTYDKTAATYAWKLTRDWLKDHGV